MSDQSHLPIFHARHHDDASRHVHVRQLLERFFRHVDAMQSDCSGGRLAWADPRRERPFLHLLLHLSATNLCLYSLKAFPLYLGSSVE